MVTEMVGGKIRRLGKLMDGLATPIGRQAKAGWERRRKTKNKLTTLRMKVLYPKELPNY